MRAVVQRVKSARVEIDERTVSCIGHGLLILVGVAKEDRREDAVYLAEKIANLRVFDDGEGKMNLSVNEVGGSALVVSNFTVCGDCRKGRRPSFTEAAPVQEGRELYELFVAELRKQAVPVATGEFQAYMQVFLQNDGPVTLMLESNRPF